MANSKRAKDQMGRPIPDVRCKKHPKHQQSPGVCSLCLSERLSRLSNRSRASRTATNTVASSCSSLSSCSSYSSSNASSCSSPIHRYRLASEGKGSLSFLSSKINNALTKSRSMAFVPRMRGGGGTEGKKKGGFWSKLLGSRSKRTDDKVLMHSRTVRERVANRVR